MTDTNNTTPPQVSTTPESSPVDQLFAKLRSKRRVTNGAFGGKRRHNHVRNAKRQ